MATQWCTCLRSIAIAPTIALWCLAPGGCAAKPYQPRQPIALQSVPIQYNFSKTHATFCIDDEQWQAVQALFQPPAATARDERVAIAAAVCEISRIAGLHTPTHRDLARNRANPLGDGAMDCRDESANTTTYLALLNQHQLLVWHQVMQRTFRGPLQLDSHWSALIRDRTDGQLYVVDPWYLDHGHPPRIQRLEHWLRKEPAPATMP